MGGACLLQPIQIFLDWEHVVNYDQSVEQAEESTPDLLQMPSHVREFQDPSSYLT